MKVSIYPRKAIEKLIRNDFQENVTVISFCAIEISDFDKKYKTVDYSSKTKK